jgi:YbbR domain-containing protein
MKRDLSAVGKAVLANKGVKLLSLLLAVIAWYTIQEAIRFETVLEDVPLQVKVDEGWAVLDQSAATVDILFRGSQDAIRGLSRDRVSVTVDVSGRKTATTLTLGLDPRLVRAVAGVRALEIRPPQLTLSLDQEGDRLVPVKVEIAGSPPAGHEVDKVECDPASVLVLGPRQRLREIEVVQTAPIDLEGRVRSFQLTSSLIPPSDRWVARMEPARVKVSVSLLERAATREFDEVRVFVLANPDLGPSLRLSADRVKVVLTGPPDVMDALQKADIRAYVDSIGLAPAARQDLPVRVHAPAGVSVTSVQPPTVSVLLDAPPPAPGNSEATGTAP